MAWQTSTFHFWSFCLSFFAIIFSITYTSLVAGSKVAMAWWQILQLSELCKQRKCRQTTVPSLLSVNKLDNVTGIFTAPPNIFSLSNKTHSINKQTRSKDKSNISQTHQTSKESFKLWVDSYCQTIDFDSPAFDLVIGEKLSSQGSGAWEEMSLLKLLPTFVPMSTSQLPILHALYNMITSPNNGTKGPKINGWCYRVCLAENNNSLSKHYWTWAASVE